MFACKKKYYLIIESIKDINLRNIKSYNKFLIIYRNQGIKENLRDLRKFRKTCRIKLIEFYVANDMKLAILLRADGIYLSSYNKTYKILNLKRLNFKIIGSAHNINEIVFKIKQGCSYILLSKLFPVDYEEKSKYLNVVKFNTFSKNFPRKLIPLGGIKINNLNKLRITDCEAFALLTEIKKKPAKILSRLF